MEEKECFLDNNIKNNCLGCQACKIICPKHCISMTEDNEGFKYPQIDKEKCINCGFCKKVCPKTNSTTSNQLDEKHVVAYRTKNEVDLQKAASGGAFGDICKAVYNLYVDKKIAVFGCSYGENFKVEHTVAFTLEDVEKFYKSKYVQSDINNTYSKVIELLSEDYFVLFSGTPCQIAGLKSYLGKSYDNLLLVDLVCHGVPSQKFFNKYIEFEENKYNDSIRSINFREKKKGSNCWNSRLIRLKFEESKQDVVEDSTKNMFLRAYHSYGIYRPSCYNCEFSTKNRLSDITIGDCWGIEGVVKNVDVHEGVSMIIANTQKGLDICNRLDGIVIKELDEEFAIKNNYNYDHCTKYNKNRDKFYEELDTLPFDKLVKKFTVKPSLWKKALGKCKRVVQKLLGK